MKTNALNDYSYHLARNAIIKLDIADLYKRAITLEEVEESLCCSFNNFSDLFFVQVTGGSWRIADSNESIGIKVMKYLIENFA